MTAFENNAERVECYKCNGTKILDHGPYGDGKNRVMSECDRCDGKGTVLVDKPCGTCSGEGSWEGSHGRRYLCERCRTTGVEPRDKRMDRLMREAVEHYAGDYPPFTHGGACRIEGLPLHIGCTGRDPSGFTGWCVANWQMRKDGQG